MPTDLSKLKKRKELYNMVPNVIWSILNLVPVSVFCYRLMNLSLFFTFLAPALLTVFLPNSFFNKMQLGTTTSIYKKLGVHIVNKVAQNGDVINALIRKRFPDYKVISSQRSSINKLLQQTYMFEKFHFMMFVLFSLITVYALGKSYFGWAIAISVTNLAYNIYPNLLQQYIRLKLMLYKKRVKSN